MKKRETNEQMERQQPCYYPREGASTIVVFIHGIVEGPDQFLGLMKRSSNWVLLLLLCYYRDMAEQGRSLHAVADSSGWNMSMRK